MTTKTKTQTDILALAQQSREALADAQKTVQTRRAALALAESEVQSIEIAWNRGDEAITANDLMTAQAEVTRCSGLLAAALNAVRRAERTLINDDAGLAETVLPVLEKMLPGVPVEVHTITPKDDPGTVPVLRVVQAKRANRNSIYGIISDSDLEIVGYFPSWTEGVNLLDRDNLSRALDNAEIRTRENGIRSSVNASGEVVVHRAQVAVAQATEPVPVIRGDLNPSNVSYLAQRLASEVKGQGWLPTRGEFMFSATAGKDYAILPEKVDSDGVRRAECRFALTVRPEVDKSIEARNNAQRIATETINGMVGRFATGLGRAEAIHATPGESGLLTVAATFVSRMP